MIAASDSRPITNELIVLDAHGVVFDRAFPQFVRRHAAARGDDPKAVWQLWRRDHRLDFWSGRTEPHDMWNALFPGDDPARLTADLERSYRPGPLFEQVVTSTRQLWLLSNHRSGWLLPRLERFGIADRFERVIVSDRIGAAKPDPAVFEFVRDETARRDVCLLDDSIENVNAARRVGLNAQHVDSPSRPETLPTTRRSS